MLVVLNSRLCVRRNATRVAQRGPTKAPMRCVVATRRQHDQLLNVSTAGPAQLDERELDFFLDNDAVRHG